MFVSVTTFCSSRNSMKHYFCLFFKSWKKPKLTYYTVAILFLQFFSSFCHALLMKMTVCKICNTLNNKYCSKICAHDFGKKPFDSKKDAKWPILTQNFKQLFSQHTVCFFGQFFQKKNFGFFSFWYNELVHFFRLSSLHTQKTLSRFSVYEKNDDEFEQKTYCKLLFYSWLYTLYVYIIFSTYSSKNHAAVYHD